MTPSCSLDSSMTRTSRARIFPFLRCLGSREANERGGRLNQPSAVEIHSCAADRRTWNTLVDIEYTISFACYYPPASSIVCLTELHLSEATAPGIFSCRRWYW